jgi:hypothetical protein
MALAKYFVEYQKGLARFLKNIFDSGVFSKKTVTFNVLLVIM